MYVKYLLKYMCSKNNDTFLANFLEVLVYSTDFFQCLYDSWLLCLFLYLPIISYIRNFQGTGEIQFSGTALDKV
jgi:hypothetical protein